MSEKYIPSWAVELEIMDCIGEHACSTTAIIYGTKYKEDTVRKSITHMVNESKLLEIEAERTKYEDGYYRLSAKGKMKLLEYKKRKESDERARQLSFIKGQLQEHWIFCVQKDGWSSQYYRVDRYKSVVNFKGDECSIRGYDSESETYLLTNGMSVPRFSEIKIHRKSLKPLSNPHQYLQDQKGKDPRELQAKLEEANDRNVQLERELKAALQQIKNLERELRVSAESINNLSDDKAELLKQLHELNPEGLVCAEIQTKDKVKIGDSYFLLPDNAEVVYIVANGTERGEYWGYINASKSDNNGWFLTRGKKDHPMKYGMIIKVKHEILQPLE